MAASKAPNICLLGLALVLGSLVQACGGGERPAARVTADRSQIQLAHGEMGLITLTWDLLRDLDNVAGDLTLFVHLLDPEGELVRTFDRAFPRAWSPGDRIEEEIHIYHSLLAPALPAGTYVLSIGLVDAEGRRWSLETSGEEVRRQEYGITAVEVPDRIDVARSIRFSDSWGAPAKGRDLQVLVARWLEGTGSLSVGPSERPSNLWLKVRIPSPSESHRIVLDDGATGPTLKVSSTCSEMVACLAGGGGHELEVPLPATEAPCDILLEANYYVVDVALLSRMSVVLEQAGWTSAEVRDLDSPGDSD